MYPNIPTYIILAMILTLQNVIYYLYDNNFIDENRIFSDNIEARQEESLNNTFLVKFTNDPNDGRVVKQAFNVSEMQRKALLKDAYLTCLFEKAIVLGEGNEKCEDVVNNSIDYNKLIYVRKYISGVNFYSFIKSNVIPLKYLTIEYLSNNNQEKISEIIIRKLKLVHIKQHVDTNLDLNFNLSFPISIPVINISSSFVQQFWRQVNTPIKDYIILESAKWGKADGYRSLIHGDFSLKNILYSSDRIFHFVDWEFAQYGNPVWDYAWLISDMQNSFPNDELAKVIDDFETQITQFITTELLKKYVVIAKIRRLSRKASEGILSEEDLKKVNELNHQFSKI